MTCDLVTVGAGVLFPVSGPQPLLWYLGPQGGDRRPQSLVLLQNVGQLQEQPPS